MCYSVRSFRTPLHQKEQILLKRRKDNKISQNQTDFACFYYFILFFPIIKQPPKKNRNSELHTRIPYLAPRTATSHSL